MGIATCAELPDLDEDGPALVSALSAIGVAAEPVRWDDPAVDWPGYDLVVIRSTWDYVDRRDEFVAWAHQVPRLLNPAAIVAWNTHKGYLAELASAGVPVVSTIFLPPGEPVELPTAQEYVVKPAVGAGAKDTARYTADDHAAAGAHVDGLHRAGRTAMVQPYLSGVDVLGETGLIYLGGAYSHSIRKGPLLGAGNTETDGLHRAENISTRTPSPDELALAGRVLDAVPGGSSQLLYARVDLLPGPAGTPLLLELELTEPSLFLDHAPGGAGRFAAAIAVGAGRAAQPASP